MACENVERHSRQLQRLPQTDSHMNLNPRIWRSGKSDFYADEIFQAASVYTSGTLADIRSEGFDSIWLRGRLYDLMESRIFPELNQPRADERIRHLQELIRRGHESGVGIWLFFNEPLALPSTHPFWQKHHGVQGERHYDPLEQKEMAALCVSSPQGRDFFAEAVVGMLAKLPGLAGVILITASEHHSHCWSHHVCRPTGDKYMPLAARELSCPCCRKRGAASVVLDLISTWRQAMPAQGRVLAWNWSWSMWYDDPQKEIVGKLPTGVELLADWERGGRRQCQGRTIPIDEYSLGYIGPSERFLGTRDAARPIPIHAKLQINTTHELATVPNLPLLPNLHAKWIGLQREGVAGVMGCWNFGCLPTLNTHAFRLFHELPARWTDEAVFLKAVAESYFGDVEAETLAKAWTRFCLAFESYPFSFGIIYHSPINYAPAYPLNTRYLARPMGPSHLQHEWGDHLEDTLGDWTVDEVVRSFESLLSIWNEGLAFYRKALLHGNRSKEQERHREQELSCAEMAGCHFSSMIHIYRFHQWRAAAMARLNLKPPCEIPLGGMAGQILRDEISNARVAMCLARKDPRLGFHEEAQAVFYDASSIGRKISRLELVLNKSAL